MTTVDEPQTAVSTGATRRLRRARQRGRQQRPEWGPGRWLTYVVLVIGAILFVAPFAWLVGAFFRHMSEIFSNPPTWIPHHPTIAGYKQFLNLGNLTRAQRGRGTGDWRWFANSAFVATSVTVLQTFFNAMAAYVFAKRSLPGRDAIFLVLGHDDGAAAGHPHPELPDRQAHPAVGGSSLLGNGGHGWLDSYWDWCCPARITPSGSSCSGSTCSRSRTSCCKPPASTAPTSGRSSGAW